MYYFISNSTFRSGFSGIITPYATVTSINGATETVNSGNPVDYMQRVYWEPQSITVLNYDPFTQIKHVSFILDIQVTQAIALLSDAFSSITASIIYEDGSYYNTANLLSTYGNTNEGIKTAFACVRYVLNA